MADPDEPLDHAAAREALGRVVDLQYRSVLSYAVTAGAVTGASSLALADVLSGFAQAELDDLRRLVEKLVALGGRPPSDVPSPAVAQGTDEAIAALVDSESEVLDALGKVIDTTGGDAESEALEHRLEHIIMRKREQVELLERTARA